MAILAPSAAALIAIASPSPDAPPVMRITLSLSSYSKSALTWHDGLRGEATHPPSSQLIQPRLLRPGRTLRSIELAEGVSAPGYQFFCNSGTRELLGAGPGADRRQSCFGLGWRNSLTDLKQQGCLPGSEWGG